MLTPAEGVAAMVDFVVATIEKAGPSASPPVTVGVGLGGTFEKSALLAKRALTRTSGSPNADPELAALERRILDRLNATGIGPAGFGGMIGKGRRGATVRESMREHGCVYFGAIEGTAALLARRVVSAEVIAYADLGTEAVRRLEVVDFPVVVVNDLHGGDLYEEGPRRWRRQ